MRPRTLRFWRGLLEPAVKHDVNFRWEHILQHTFSFVTVRGRLRTKTVQPPFPPPSSMAPGTRARSSEAREWLCNWQYLR